VFHRKINLAAELPAVAGRAQTAIRSLIVAALAVCAIVLTFIPTVPALAGDTRGWCRDLTLAVAAPSSLTPADEEYCRQFGDAAIRMGIPSIPGPSSSGDEKVRARMTILIAEITALHPELANQCLAARTMAAALALVSGELTNPIP
jgi:hypothetical protein